MAEFCHRDESLARVMAPYWVMVSIIHMYFESLSAGMSVDGFMQK